MGGKCGRVKTIAGLKVTLPFCLDLHSAHTDVRTTTTFFISSACDTPFKYNTHRHTLTSHARVSLHGQDYLRISTPCLISPPYMPMSPSLHCTIVDPRGQGGQGGGVGGGWGAK